MSFTRVGFALGAVVLLASGCGSSGEEQVTKMTDLLVNTAASTQGQAAFVDAGVDVTSALSCNTQPSGDEFTVSCTGTSIDGKPITLTGTATSLPGGSSVAGNFVGTAAGSQVFATDCLGSC